MATTTTITPNAGDTFRFATVDASGEEIIAWLKTMDKKQCALVKQLTLEFYISEETKKKVGVWRNNEDDSYLVGPIIEELFNMRMQGTSTLANALAASGVRKASIVVEKVDMKSGNRSEKGEAKEIADYFEMAVEKAYAKVGVPGRMPEVVIETVYL